MSTGISVLSYAGEVVLGITTDSDVVGDPELIVEFFQEEVERLAGLSSATVTGGHSDG